MVSRDENTLQHEVRLPAEFSIVLIFFSIWGRLGLSLTFQVTREI